MNCEDCKYQKGDECKVVDIGCPVHVGLSFFFWLSGFGYWGHFKMSDINIYVIFYILYNLNVPSKSTF